MKLPLPYDDEHFMQRALQLAALGRGKVSPNPLVGSVVVYEGKVIGEGWHKIYGGDHAEVMAISEVADISMLNNSTVYVNLEPCSHTGKTPPCADLLVRQGVKRVVVANQDPNPLVCGRGIQKLRAAGIQVDLGVCEAQGRWLNKRFFTFQERKRPYVILKWAQTTDGFLARTNLDSKWISNAYSRQLVHKWRAEEDAVLVTWKTALADGAKLTVREWGGRNPIRIVLDRNNNLKGRELSVFNEEAPTLCYNTKQAKVESNNEWVKLNYDNFLLDTITDMFNRNIQSVIVEGGAEILRTFLDLNLWDEARIFVGNQKYEDGILAPRMNKSHDRTETIDGDNLLYYFN